MLSWRSCAQGISSDGLLHGAQVAKNSSPFAAQSPLLSPLSDVKMALKSEGSTAASPQRESISGSYPLTALQSGMLYHEIGGVRGVDIEQIVCRTPEQVDPATFSCALQSLVSMHPVLCTRFVYDAGDEPRQEIVNGVTPVTRFLDRTLIPSPDRASDFQQTLLMDRLDGLPLAEAPLIRGTVVCYADDDTRILLTVHHAIVDGRCFPVLLDDLFRCYASHRDGAAPPAPVPRLPFRSFVEWGASRNFESRSRQFWSTRLKGFTAPTPLTVDDLPDGGGDPLHWQDEIVLSEMQTSALHTLVAAADVTLHSVIQAAWCLLLSRYASETDVVFGGTRACRKSSISDVGDAIGLFINTLPVRASLDADKPLLQLVRELRQQWLDMRDHEHTPLGRVQAWSDIEKGQPLFDSILVFENFDLGEVMKMRGGAWAHREVELYERTNFPITVAAYAGIAHLRIKIEFDSEKFSRATVQRMLGHMRSLLDQFVATPDAPLRTFRLTSEDELRALRDVWASPQSFAVPDTLASWFANQAATTPDRPALSDSGRTWTYCELDAASNRVAHTLISAHGVRRGDIVGICVERSAEIVIGILGILKSGAAYLPIDLAYPADRLAWMLEDSGAAVLLTQRSVVDQLPDTRAAIVTFESIIAAASPDFAPDLVTDPDDLAYVIFTSGSTGKPKGCRVTNRNVARLMKATEQYYSFNEEDVWTLFHSFAFDFSVWEIWGALLYGGRLVVVPHDVTRSPDDFYALLVAERVTVLNQTPSAFRLLIAAEARTGTAPAALALRYVIFGGEALELQSLRPWFTRHGDQQPQLINMYGITETTVHVTYRPIGQKDLASGSVIGRQISDLEIHLLDAFGHAVPIGVPGEIHVGGAGVTAGYLNRPELTASRFIPHPYRVGQTLYRTGDVARFLPTQDLEYLGRADDQVKLRGFRIELGEIQSVLMQHPAVRDAFVTVFGTGDGKRIVAYLVGDRYAGSLAVLREFAGRFLPPYMIPGAIVFVDHLPLTHNGKVDRKALPAPEEGSRAEVSTAYQPPQGDIEILLSQIMARALQVERVGRDEDYFELGGDSILSIQIVTSARIAGLTLKPRDLFERRTVQQLALVAAARPAPSGQRQEAIAGPAPLTPIQRWFFRHELPNPNHWTQAFLFNLTVDVDAARWQRALADLVLHHAALRTAFQNGMQEIHTAPHFVFRQVDGPVTASELRAHCESAQQALRIDEGLLLSAVYFAHPAGVHAARVYLAVHHLGVDGVSWRILLEDLEALLAGTGAAPVPTPFVNWAHHLSGLANDAAILSQHEYWQRNARPFRLSSANSPVTTAADAQSIFVRLTRSDTDELSGPTVQRLRATLDEVLLTSVAASIARVAGVSDIALDVESHGRREASPLDLSRTVGWFTTIAPLALAVDVHASLAQLVATTKRAMRDVPERGFGFGLLEIDDPGRDVLFNFLGRFDQVTSGSRLFSFASEGTGSWYDGGSSRSHLLEINSWIKDGCLEFTWTFAGLPPEMIAVMADACAKALAGLSQEVRHSDAWIANDFPLAPLRDRDLSFLVGDVADVLPLTPVQQLYYTLETARPGSAIDQWYWTLTGTVDAAALRQAWNSALSLHPGLRTEFHGAGLTEPVQVVRPRVDIAFETVNVTEAAGFEAVLAADRARGVRIDTAPLMRLTLVETPGLPARLIWTHHHLQIDGWSWPVVLATVSAAYRAITSGNAPSMHRGPSIRNYLEWFSRVDLEPSRRFWRQYLDGVSSPTPVSSQARGAAVFGEVSAALSHTAAVQLSTLSRRLKCPLNALVQSAWAILLSARAGSDDVVFGATFAGRSTDVPDVASIVGAFVNNLPVRVRVDASASFEALATMLQHQGIDLEEHQHLPLREIQELSDVPLRSLLFESLVVFQNYSIDGEAMRWSDDVAVTDFVAPVRTTYPLTLVVRPGAAALNLDLVYQGGFFDAAEATYLLEAFCALLTRVAATPALSVDACRTSLALPTIVRSTRAPEPRGAEHHPPVSALQRRIARVWQRAFGVSDVGIDENFFDLGGHSLLLIRVHALLCRELARELSVVDVFSNPTIRKLASALETSEQPAAPVHVVRAARQRAASDAIAIIGMSGRFPGADSVAEFWQNLRGNVESIDTFSDEALRLEGLDPAAMRAAGQYVQRRGQLPDPDRFDAAFFGMSPMEAAATDPQQRLFLEVAWSALEDAGYAPSRVADRIGVFAGMSNNTFYEQYVQPDTELRSQLGDLIVMMGNEKDYLATRTAYKLNLHGPALNIYTACSTSLVALAEAVYALRDGRCEMAIAGAVSVTFPQNRGYFHEEGGITSPDGHCRPFDARAAGTVFSNGIAAVILKPLDRAIADGDTIQAVVRGVGINNDGSDKVSFTAPSVAGQAGAIREAYDQAGVSPDTIGYVEAHGTATALGDPIEFEALTSAYRAHTGRVQFCGIGSVKSNVGHLDAAAGMAGLIKATLAIRDGVIPATLHFERAHPALRMETSPFRVVAQNETWTPLDGIPRRAGVSSFGVGGTNAHVVLEQAPAREPSSPSPRRHELLVLSAKSPDALQRQRHALADFLDAHPDASLPDLAFTLATGRETFSHRVAVVANSAADASARLRDDRVQSHTAAVSDLPVAFLFPGQGAQFSGMGRPFYETEPVFRAAIDQCAGILLPILGQDIRPLMFDEFPSDDTLLHQTFITQPVLFAMSYGLAQLWKAHGVTPTAMIGHSVGEYAAACLAGAMSLESALRLLAVRGRMMHSRPGGSMLSIRLPESDVRALLTEGVEIASVNSPVMTVVAGASPAIAALAQRLTRDEIPHRDLRTSHAFHTAMMDAVIEPFRDEVSSVEIGAPSVPFVSNVTGEWVTPPMVQSPDYWASHLRRTVRFEDGLRTLAAERTVAMLEVGPGNSCVTFARQTIVDGSHVPMLTSLPKDNDATPFLQMVGSLWSAGGRIDWSAYFHAESRHRISLPTYAFERKRFWPNARALALPLPARHLASMPNNTVAAGTGMSLESVRQAPQPSYSRSERLVQEVRDQIQRISGFDEIDERATFLDLGLDSLLIGQAAVTLSRYFGTRITFRHLLDEHDSVQSLAAYLDATLEPSRFQAQAPVAAAATLVGVPAARTGSIDDRVARLELLIQQMATGTPAAQASAGDPAPHAAGQGFASGQLHRGGQAPVTFGPFRPVATGGASAQSLTTRQRAHLDSLIAAYTARTARSKANVAESRHSLADPRAAAGFNRLWKEMVYPVVSTGSQGATLVDLDGNEWIDVTLGFGLGLFGHRPNFVVNAVAEQLNVGFEIGPSSPLAGEVAALLCEVSGKDRATFCDTGSEAVTAAIRVARTVTRRDKIAVFQGSYHGIFDEVLGRPLVHNGQLTTAPIAPGITDDSLANILILEYGNPESIEFIKRYADDLAAVLVEPVQSRRPDLQPRAFLEELRAVTAAHEIALVFDEVVTGFRCHPRGAQAVFGIDADLVTYGKVMGGGMPIGALAGRRKYMDALDGGAWNYGDDSGPDASVTFFAGTFVRHPLALAAARAVLTELKARGPSLQETLDRRTAQLVDQMNAFAVTSGVPVNVSRFSSMFMITFAPGLKFSGLFFYHMRLRGVHIWETRPSFLSIAHSDAQVGAVLDAFRDSIAALQDGGFFPGGERGDLIPVTPEQEELLIASAMGDEYSRAFNESISILFDGQLNRDALAAAVRDVLTRHEALRAVFEHDGSAQRFLPANHADFAVTEVDMRGKSVGEVNACRSGVIDGLFRLNDGPLVRVHLLARSASEHELLIVAHHAVCDGWSFGVLYEDILAHYRRATGVADSLPAVSSFRDFVERQNLADVRQARDEDTQYWVTRLASLPPTLKLPVDLRDGSESLECRSATRAVPDALSARVLEFCKETRLTPYTLFFAAYRDVLHRLSAQDSFCIGTPIASQAAAGLPGLCGHGVHFLPLPCDAAADVTIREYLAANRTLILDSLDHQETTLSRILQRLPKGARLEPISAIFTLETTSPAWTGDGVSVRLQSNAKRRSTFDLSLFATDDHGKFTLLASSRAGKFSQSSVAGWLDLIIAWLAAVVETPVTTLLADLPLVNAVAVAPDGNVSLPTYDLISLFSAQARRSPDASALRTDAHEYSYATVDRLAAALSLRLLSAGVTQGSCVVLNVDRSAEFVIAVLAILRCGAAYVPIDPAYPSARKQQLLDDVSPSLVVDAPLLQKLFFELDQHAPPAAPAIVISPDDLAYVMFTSGSTGRPKGVMVPHRGIARLVHGPGCIDIDSRDVFLLSSALSFDASTLEIWGALLNGGCLAIPAPGILTIHEIAECLHRHRVSILWLTSGLFQAMMDERPESLATLRILLVGGDVLSVRHVAKALDVLATTRLINGYGPTENTTFTTVHEITRDDLARVSIPIGKAIPGTSVVILDDMRRPVPAGVAGELCTGGSGLALGYLNRPELTSAVFIANPSGDPGFPMLYRTGDRCRVCADGTIEFVGRIDNQVKIRGFRVEPGEIEAVISAQPGVTACRVVVHSGDATGKVLLAFCTGTPTSKPDVTNAVQRLLPKHMQPASITFVESFPLNVSGKVDNTALLRHLDTNGSADAFVRVRVPPATDTERIVFKAWRDLLGDDQFGVTETFFELGGHSLLGLRLFNRLASECGFVRPLAVLFEHSTIRALAAEIDRTTASVASVSHDVLATLRKAGSGAPLFLIHGGDGGVMFYRSLVDRMGGLDAPVYAIESPSLNNRARSVPDMGSLVTQYLTIIRSKQPQGPYRIAGYSFGGIVGFEIASRLHAMGELVKLVIFDTDNPAVGLSRKHGVWRRIDVAWKRFDSESLLPRIGKIAQRIAGRRANERIRQGTIRRLSTAWNNGMLTDLEDRALYLNELYQQLLANYVPRGRVPDALLIKSSMDVEGVDLPPDYGWGSVIGTLHLASVPANHFTLFEPPAIDAMVPALQQYLR